jgi:hypothetical protein
MWRVGVAVKPGPAELRGLSSNFRTTPLPSVGVGELVGFRRNVEKTKVLSRPIAT